MNQNLNEINGYNYIGCYLDSKDRALKNNIGKGLITDCIDLAKKKGYDTVGIQYGNQYENYCWAGDNNKDNNNYFKYGIQTDISKCNIEKPGEWTNIIYSNKNSSRSKLSTGILLPNQKLNIGSILYSDNRQFYLILQQDGNLCIYDNDDKNIWCSKTKGKSSKYLIFQPDGNLVIFSDTKPIWDTNTNKQKKKGISMSIDNDGVMRIWNNANENIWSSSKPISNIKSTIENISQVDFTYNSNASNVYVLGNYGIAPWGMDKKFPDKTAQWIWYTNFANTNSPTTTQPITIQYIYSNTSKILLNGILYVMIDNSCDIYLNKNKLGTNINQGWLGTLNQINFTIQPGDNLFEFDVKNDGGPGGLLVSAITLGNGHDNSNVLFHTNSYWKFIPIFPTTIISCNLSQSGMIVSTDKYFPWGCLYLNSSLYQYVNIGLTITGMNGLTFGFWFKSENKENKENKVKIFDFGNGPSNDNILMYIHNNNIVSNLFITNILINELTTSTKFDDNKWNHIVWTISKPNNNISNWIIYLNGKSISNSQSNYPNNVARTNCYLGKSNGISDPYFNGLMSNFVMYQKELSNFEVDALFNSMINSYDPELYIYLPFSTNSVLDTILNNYAGKIFNLPIIKSNIKNENWNCIQSNNIWVPIKMSNGNPVCMSLNGSSCSTYNEKKNCETKLLNPVTPEIPVVCTEQKDGWCIDAKKFFSEKVNSLNSKLDNIIINQESKLTTNNESIEIIKPSIRALDALDISSQSESIILKPLTGGGKILSINNINDINNLLIDGIFKLRVNLPMMPSYIKGKNFDISVGTGTEPNYFYLSIEKLDNNCSIKSPNGSCINLFADDKKCSVKALTSFVQNNSYRLVLVSSQYVLDSSIPFGKNSDFTLININGQTYLKNVQTGYCPSLYSNDSNILVYGDMLINSNTNINQVQNQITNTLCGQDSQTIPTNSNLNQTQNIRCNIEQNPGLYLITNKNIGESSPIRININSDKTISLNLLMFNKYGFPTKNYALTYCNFNVKTYSFIEKITNNLGTFLVNMVCFSDVQNPNTKASDQLKFTVELINFPPNFIKNNSVFTIG